MGISIWQLLIVLVIVLLLFGTKRLKNLGSDLGNAIKGFRSSMNDEDDSAGGKVDRLEQSSKRHVIDGEVAKKDSDRA